MIAAGLPAVLFRPERLPAPAVVTLGGSRGGFSWSADAASYLAASGFVALAVAYFGAAGVPLALSRISLDRLAAAVAWLGRRPFVLGPRVSLVGTSRGAELALLLSAWFDGVGAVVAFAPSGVIWGGFDAVGGDAGAAWTLAGQDMPFLVPDSRLLDAAFARRPVVLVDAYAAALADADRVAAATIPVERLDGPILLVSGGQDRVWPSGVLAELAMRRRSSSRRTFPDGHMHFERAGHGLGQPPGLPALPGAAVHPVDGVLYALGGRQRDNARASKEAWRGALKLLAERGNLQEAP